MGEERGKPRVVQGIGTRERMQPAGGRSERSSRMINGTEGLTHAERLKRSAELGYRPRGADDSRLQECAMRKHPGGSS